MKSLLNPKWIFIVNTLPIIILFILSIGQYNIIKSLLEDSNKTLWLNFGIGLAILCLAHILYASYSIVKKKSVSILYAISTIISSVAYLYCYIYYINRIVPFNIPQWLLSSNLFLYVGTFLMPTLAYALFVLIVHTSFNARTDKVWVNFLAAVAIPLAGYIFLQVILPLHKVIPLDSRWAVHSLVVLGIVATILFLFFLVRGIFIIATNTAAFWTKYSLAWKIPLTILLPVLGLLLQNGVIYHAANNVFGNFTSVWFYILAVANGLVLCLPNLQHLPYRLVVFSLRCILYTFTLYFFIVFLPFLPFSFMALLAFGIGFLLLVPLLLFVVHTNTLYKDYHYITSQYNPLLIKSVMGICFLVIPTAIHINYMQHKHSLSNTLQYIYEPNLYAENYKEKESIDIEKLSKTINIIKQQKAGRNELYNHNTIPYLSTYFNWLVLDNLTLSDTKINTIERIFFNAPSINTARLNTANDKVEITNIQTNSTYNPKNKTWLSQVDVQLTNNSASSAAEYATTLHLPDGCYISDYYLYVGDKKELGILAEKKAAMWVYSQIRNTRKDPGILYYLTGNNVAFRVFPFARNEVRKTGIELIHKSPIALQIDGQTLHLGTENQAPSAIFENEFISYIPASKKQSLRTAQRRAYFHFIVDASANQAAVVSDYQTRIKHLLQTYPELADKAKISFVNSFAETYSLQQDWQALFNKQVYKGGFFAERAIQKALVASYNTASYPIIVVLTENMDNAIIEKDFADLDFTFPESTQFYRLGKGNQMQAYSLLHTPTQVLANDSTLHKHFTNKHPVLAYTIDEQQTAYLPNNDAPSLVLKKVIYNIEPKDLAPKDWRAAANMQAVWRSNQLQPSQAKSTWLPLIKSSFKTGILNPLTAYIVVENEAQKAMLLSKQQQTLKGNKNLDVGDDAQSMAEPNIFWLSLLLGVVVGFKYWHRRRMQVATID